MNRVSKFSKSFTAALFAFLLFFAGSSCFGAAKRGGQNLIEPGHWVYDALEAVQLESGIVFLSEMAPLSLSEIKTLLLEVNYDDLSQPGKAQYDRIFSYFDELDFSLTASIFSLGIEPSVNPEGYYKSNDSIPWTFDRYMRRSLLAVPVSLGVGDYAWFYADIAAAQGKTAMGRGDNYHNVPYSGDTFDINFPHKGYASLGTKLTENTGFNFKLGNMNQNFGRTSLGSVMISEYMTEATTAELKFFSPVIEYAFSVIELNTNRYLYMHKLEMRPHKKISISLMESCLPYGALDLKFLNPFAIYHGYAAWKDYQGWESDVGSYFGAKINYVPAKYFRLYSLFAMTQFQTSAELSGDSDDPANLVPNGMGWQLGAESFIPAGSGHVRLNLEGYYAQPYLYINESPNWSYVKTYKENFNGSDKFYEWVGTKYGPDTAAGKFDVSYEVPAKWKVGLSYLFLARGEQSEPKIFKKAGWGGNDFEFATKTNDNWVYPNKVNGVIVNRGGREKVAPSGLPEYVNTVSLCASYSPLNWLSFYAQPSYTFVFNSGHKEGSFECAFEMALAIRCYLTRINR